MAEEIFRARIFIEAADQIGNRVLKFLLCRDRTIEEHVARQFLHDAADMVGHPFQHFKTDIGLDLIFKAEEHGKSDVE